MLLPRSECSINGFKVAAHHCGALVLAAAMLHAASAQAGDSDASMFSVSGFGSLGVVHSSESSADFNHSFTQANGAGYSRSWSPDVDSRLGAQVSANFSDRLSAVVQLISEQQWDGSFTPIVEWANMKYAFTPDFSVRIGRIALPTTLLSESSKVAYTFPWVRPPVEVNRLMPVTNSDGVDATYRFRFGQIKHSVTAHYGSNKVKAPDGSATGSSSDGRDLVGLGDTMTNGAITLHFGYLQGRVLLWKLFSVPALSALAKERFTITTGSASYDPGNWFVTAEALRKTLPLSGDQFGWYVSAGPRIGKFTPYLNYAVQKQLSQPGLLKPGGHKAATAGIRVDMMENIDFKLQYERVRNDMGNTGALVARTGFQPGGKVGIFSAVVDFVY